MDLNTGIHLIVLLITAWILCRTWLSMREANRLQEKHSNFQRSLEKYKSIPVIGIVEAVFIDDPSKKSTTFRFTFKNLGRFPVLSIGIYLRFWIDDEIPDHYGLNTLLLVQEKKILPTALSTFALAIPELAFDKHVLFSIDLKFKHEFLGESQIFHEQASFAFDKTDFDDRSRKSLQKGPLRSPSLSEEIIISGLEKRQMNRSS